MLKIETRVKLNKIREFQKKLLVWYKNNSRDFPWRKEKDPFKILLAEVLLQKTNVEKVQPVYKKLTTYYPTPEKLSVADIPVVREAIRPLGLQYKASRLTEMASQIIKQYKGSVPDEEKALLRLKGIGKYIASATLCFGFNKRVPIVDTNVVRLLDRVFGIKSDKNRPRDDKSLWDAVSKLVPQRNPKKFNWALLDFSALICKSRHPLCDECPIISICKFYMNTHSSGKEGSR